MDNTNGNLADAYTGTTTPTNTQASRLNASSTTVPSGAAVSKEFTDAASTSFQRNQTDTQKVIDDYNKKIAVIDAKISALTAEKAKIEANLNNKDFSDEERRMIESYTTLGDLDAGVKQIMSNRQFKSALAQTQFNEDKYNQEAKDAKTLAYENAVNDAATFVVDNTEAATGKMPEAAEAKYGSKMVTVHDAARGAGIKNVVADEYVKVKVAEMRSNTGAGGNKNPDAVDPVAAKVNDIVAKYNDLRNGINLNKFEKADLKTERPTKVQAAINDLVKKLSEINSLDISSEDKTKYENLINPMIKDFVVYRDASRKQQAGNNAASGWSTHVAAAKNKAATLDDRKFKEWLAGSSKAATAIRSYLKISPEDVTAAGFKILDGYRKSINSIVVKE